MQHDADLELFRDNFRRFMKEHIAPHYEQWERDGIMPRHVWNLLGENGFLCVDVPEEYGGYGVPTYYSLMLVEESARAGYSSLSTGISCHSEIAAPYILNIGSEEQKQYWLPKMVSGEVVGAIGMTEPGAGSDLQSMRTNAILQDDCYILNGSKTFISNGQHADLVVLAAKTDPQARAKGVSLLLLDTHLDGFKKGTNLDKIGLHSQDTSEMFFDNIKVPQNQLLGQPGQGFAYLMQELPRERTAIAATALGAIRGSIDVTTAYVQERQAFGQPIAQFQNTRFVLAQAKIDELATAAFYERNVELYQQGQLDVATAAALKSFSTDMQMKVADNLLQLFGGYGYMSEYPISRFFVDARIQRIYGGTNEIMKEIVARSLLGK
ncbi:MULTISPECIES: acyl-CoA dehydrogenase family protein [Acinetobacter]|jgi:acyl-CoA dehydrogenase|uniref:acyl-CoA dehydrogenase family protein n=1 Tax=Acinetobacter TaxID=469 RepID=UPI000277C21C|nr:MULTISPECIES: acyl-CoA dehydrogenase family protein [Acinetobacter]EJO35275.1 acyl-CoA dehydrogenase, C-terminal domain protein [Acinetobacter radioresistens WC-A-157]EXE12922.1 acyl-CoA dehydrogenase, N-terminal domain protein [Acinetobacter sp. 983759]EXF56316.1 acyl-CoA dehydrogenase, N-terminal domain protein [Acinetobacter sp. 1294596]MCX0334851.1 acyl-CoA dehydrogenase family protein [Acinetobacter radioresistens]